MNKPTEMLFDDAKKWALNETHLVEVIGEYTTRSSTLKYATKVAKDNPESKIVFLPTSDNSWIVLKPSQTLRPSDPQHNE